MFSVPVNNLDHSKSFRRIKWQVYITLASVQSAEQHWEFNPQVYFSMQTPPERLLPHLQRNLIHV